MSSLRPSWASSDAHGVVSLWRVLKALAGVLAALGIVGAMVRWYVLEVTGDMAMDARLASTRVEAMRTESIAQQGRIDDLRARATALESELLSEVAARVRMEAGARGVDPDAAARANALFVGYTAGRWPCVQGLSCVSLRVAAQASVDGAKRAK